MEGNTCFKNSRSKDAVLTKDVKPERTGVAAAWDGCSSNEQCLVWLLELTQPLMEELFSALL